MRRAVGVATALVLVLVVAADASATVRELRVRVGGELRTYRLFTPSTAPRQTVLMFHGGRMSGAEMAAYTGFDAVAERARWAVAYPDGVGGHWNSGPCCRRSSSQRRDDVRLFDALRRDLERRGLPAGQVGVTGFSEGAFFSYRLACERARRLRAVAAVAGTMVFRPCHASRPVPLISVWMERDHLVPVAGRPWFPSAAAVSRYWRATNRCRLVSHGLAPGWTVERGRRCAAPYASFVLRGAGHGWPSLATGLVVEAMTGAAAGVAPTSLRY
jgi:polyhydroxybutyrate depolymerase